MVMRQSLRDYQISYEKIASGVVDYVRCFCLSPRDSSLRLGISIMGYTAFFREIPTLRVAAAQFDSALQAPLRMTQKA